MVEIQSIGRFYKTDNYGNLINESSIEKIQPFFMEKINNIKDICKNQLHSVELHSLYLRGSVPRGLADPSYSDIDIFAILDGDHGICDDYQNAVRMACSSIGRKVDFLALPLTDLDTLEEWELAFVIKVHGLCLTGTDLSPTIVDFPPCKKIVAGYASIAIDIKYARTIILQEKDISIRSCKQIMKQIVRAGLAICIERDSRYSPDLWLCYCVFRDWYPHKANDMLTALMFAVSNNPDPYQCLQILNSFGYWIANETHKHCRL